MASTHYDAPEVAPQYFPEVVQAPQFQHQPSQYQYAQPLPGTPIKSPDSSYAATGYTSVPEAVPYLPQPPGVDAQSAAHQELVVEKGGRKRVVCGCSLIVFILSCIIGVLAAAVIGLAAGTGVEANRAATAETQVEELKSSLAFMATTPTSASETATATAVANTWDHITNNCSSNADSVTTKTYTTQFFNKVTFTMYCNRDTPISPIMSLFCRRLQHLHGRLRRLHVVHKHHLRSCQLRSSMGQQDDRSRW